MVAPRRARSARPHAQQEGRPQQERRSREVHDTRPAKITETARIASFSIDDQQPPGVHDVRQGPDGRVNRNSGRPTATWTRDTIIGFASRLVISQPDAVSNMAVPTFDRTLVVHMTVNATEPNAPQREGAGPATVVEGLWFALKFVYFLGRCAERLEADLIFEWRRKVRHVLTHMSADLSLLSHERRAAGEWPLFAHLRRLSMSRIDVRTKPLAR